MMNLQNVLSVGVLLLAPVSAAPASKPAKQCIQLDVPVEVSATNFQYETSRIDSNIDATGWLWDMYTWSHPTGEAIITGTIEVHEEFTIGAQLCVPHGSNKSSILQIASHGLAFDKRYWDVSSNPEQHNYVDAALGKGYSILTYDRIGTGGSTKPDAYTIMQSPTEVEVLKELTKLARSGKLIESSRIKSDKNIRSYKPSKIVHLSDGAILTGFILGSHLGDTKTPEFGYEFAPANDARRFGDRPSGYMVQATESNVQRIFLQKGTFDPEVLRYTESIKNTVTVGEILSGGLQLAHPAKTYKGPVQCDEVMPHCSRCVAGNYHCQYPESQDAFKASQFDVPSSHNLDLTSPVSSSSLTFSNNVPSASASTPDDIPSGSPSPYPKSSEEQQHSNSQSSEMLNAMDLSLLSHYITHTSRDTSSDEDDLYALEVGIPNLAFNNKPLMASLLAIAAVSKCYHISTQSSAPLESLDEICELLVLADQHHRVSLQQIQAAIPTTDRCEYVLLNAIFMAIYGCARHSVRIRLAKIATLSGKQLPIELLPTGSQWISLIRAAHSAHMGLRYNPNHTLAATETNCTASKTNDAQRLETSAPTENDVRSEEDWLPEGTSRLLFPIVAATCFPALEKLHAKAQAMMVDISPPAVSEDSPDWQQPVIYRSELQACFAALEILRHVFATVFSRNDLVPKCPQAAALGLKFPPLSQVPPWLASYLGRITSGATSSPIRRTIMGFLNRVPPNFMDLVQSELDKMPVECSCANPVPWEITDSKSFPPSTIRQLAMDIFTHWLALVMVLDDVWWVGGMGEWELGRAVTYMQAQGWVDFSAATDTWWPESMLRVLKRLHNI
ncbi:hypothetical protein QQZ08_000384 [Neonectria magnoliae]|uniref:Zn(2)-C6 fungal-type domain-containing protein n=1 Tax=Neonectria magnoliae TaxID=2732573 RepID=A0ABR1IGY9_9HYPO